MVDFSLNEKDREILDEVRKEGVVRRRYSREYDDNEKMPPAEFPEAKDFDYIRTMMGKRHGYEGACTPGIFGMLNSFQTHAGEPMLTLRAPGAGIGNVALGAMGTPEQVKKWGHLQVAFANTEPGCGSDSKAIETTAVLDGDQWVLNGEKIFVSNGVTCGAAVVFATLDKSAGRGAIKAFLVERDAPGFEFVKKEHKMGLRVSDTAGYVLKDCRIPRENILGLDEEIKTGGGGFKGVMKTFNLTRPSVAAVSIGELMGCLEMVQEALEKEGIEVNWETGLHRTSAAQQKLIELESLLEAGILTILRAVWLMDCGQPNNVESSVCKAKGGDCARRGVQLAVELLGSLGITHDTLVEKLFRDARVGDIYEGTGEIQRLVVARAMLGYSSADLM
ncbi:MAG: acyl-CoA dehydrogenase [Desulfobacterales bacterium]